MTKTMEQAHTLEIGLFSCTFQVSIIK